MDGHIVSKSADAVQAMYNFGSAQFIAHRASNEVPILPALHVIITQYPDLAEWAINKARLRILKQMVNLWKGDDLFRIRAGWIYCPGVGY